MKRRSRIRKGAVAASLLAGVALLSGCGQFASLPEKERYQYIDEVLISIDYETAGKVTSFIKDNGDGVFSPSVKRITYQDDQAFETLKQRLQSHPSIICAQNFSERQVDCDMGQANIFMRRDSVDDPHVVLRITDVFNGREVEKND